MSRERVGETYGGLEGRRNPSSSAGNDKDKAINWDQFTSSFFFCNFPNSCEVSDMWRTFNNYGKVVDVYIAKKRTLKGSRFGFVRFKNCSNIGILEADLNEIWFGSYRLRVNISKYQKKSSYPTSLNGVSIQRRVSDLIIGKSFKDAVAGQLEGLDNKRHDVGMIQSSPAPVEEKITRIKLESTEGHWLSKCLVGELNNRSIVQDVNEFMECENFNIVSTSTMGGKRILIECGSTESRDKLLESCDGFNQRFKWIKPWNEDFSTIGRLANIKCFGVPLQAWSKGNFQKIGELWGEVVEISPSTIDKSFLEFGVVSIVTKDWDVIAQDVQVELAGQIYRVMVREQSFTEAYRSSDERSWVKSCNVSSSESHFSDSVGDWMGDGISVFSDGGDALSNVGVEELEKVFSNMAGSRSCHVRPAEVSKKTISNSNCLTEYKSKLDVELDLHNNVEDHSPLNYKGLDHNHDSELCLEANGLERHPKCKPKENKKRILKSLSDIFDRLVENNLTVSIGHGQTNKRKSKGRKIKFGGSTRKSKKAKKLRNKKLSIDGASITDGCIHNMSRMFKVKEEEKSKLAQPSRATGEVEAMISLGQELGIDYSKFQDKELEEMLNG